MEKVRNLLCIGEMGIIIRSNRNDDSLRRRKPQRQIALRLFQQEGNEAVQGTENRTVNDDRTLLLTILVYIFRT